MITSISIADVATYDGHGVRFEDLKEIGFVYGANGTGKTTLTNLLDNASQAEFSKCTVTWEGGSKRPTLVYNRNFREKNFANDINGVFTLGQATKEEKLAIAKMASDLSQIKATLIQKSKTLQTLQDDKNSIETSFREAAWQDVHLKYRPLFDDVFSGLKGNKVKFANRLISELETNVSELRDLEDLKSTSTTILGQAPTTEPQVKELEYKRLLEIEDDSIFGKNIVGKSDVEIGKLIDRLGISDWVNEGRPHIDGSSTCPFCQETTITKDFTDQLAAYFDDTFQLNAATIKTLAAEYAAATTKLIADLEALEIGEKEKTDSKIDLATLRSKIESIKSQFHGNTGRIETKCKELSRIIDLTSTKLHLDEVSKLIDDANKKVAKHNAIVDNHASEKSTLVSCVWRFLAEEYKTAIDQFKTNVTNKQKAIDGVKTKRDDLQIKHGELDSSIKEASKNVTSVQPSVDAINRLLKAYGFLNFKIVPSSDDKNQYQIQREDGSIAVSTLSEGEITFITFLYFLQLAKGGTTADSVTDERVIVIDDPISSLDSNVLFIVSTLIKGMLDDVRNNRGPIRQILLLTHNVYFHKEVSYISGIPEERNNTHFWILRKKNKASTLQPYLMENPIHNSYQLLWRELKNSDLNDCITIQNTMRRIIENYFKILGKYSYDDIYEKFDDPQEREICRSMMSWINEGSHTIPDDLFIQANDDVKDKYRKVFEHIFKNMNHHEHYKMMMGE